MRPILVNIPAKLLFAVALVLAVAGVVRDLIRRRRDPDAAAQLDAALPADRARRS